MGLLRRCKTGPVDAVVDRRIDARIQAVDLGPERLGIIVACLRADAVEGSVEHANDLGRLVVHDRASLLVPQNRNRDMARVGQVRPRVDLVQIVRAADRIGNHAIAYGEAPALLGHEPMHNRDIDEWRKPLQGAEDQGPMRPGAGQGNIEMIATGFGPISADPRRAGRTVSGNPTAENAVSTHETSAAGRGIVPLIVPTTVNEQSHFILLPNRRRGVRRIRPSSTIDGVRAKLAGVALMTTFLTAASAG